MNSREILLAVQAGELSVQHAKAMLGSTGSLNQNFDTGMNPECNRESYGPGPNGSGGVSTEAGLYDSDSIEKTGSIISESNNDQGLLKNFPPIGSTKEKIAIVGMSGRYPGADNLDKYWLNLLNGVNSIREIPSSRWDMKRLFDPQPGKKGKVYCKWLGMLDDVECFDPLFFNISPTEAEFMDPQHRIFMQEAYRAFENAGYSCQSIGGQKCGVYLGIMSNEYMLVLLNNGVDIANTTGNSFAIGAARIAYFMNLKGPALALDTACSSSLVGMHLACRALQDREIDMALAGGVSLYLAPDSYIGMCSAKMLSPDGKCKAFDAKANGFVPGEGVGAVVLKRLSDAIKDKDSIYGVIIESGINQDGKTNGITAPSVHSQMELGREIYRRSGINPETISYVEMHGTGTKLGDPIELEALSSVYTEWTQKRNFCAIGSVKTNIGHTSAAAGVASVHKVLLCLNNKMLVPSLNYTKSNEHFQIEQSPFYVNTQANGWETKSGHPRRAAVSSFGFSGTNAHLIIEEYLPKIESLRTPVRIDNEPILIVLSAKSDDQLMRYAELLGDYVKSKEDSDLPNIGYTLQVGREPMECRLAIVAKTVSGLVESISGFIQQRILPGTFTAKIKKNKEGLTILEGDEDAVELVRIWFEKKKLNKIAELWVKGLVVDWNLLYLNTNPRRVSLPTYPFAKERCWVSNRDIADVPDKMIGIKPIIHPLVHENSSTFALQSYSTTFKGDESFFRDHIVDGRKILPGVVFIEMIRVAVEHAASDSEDGDKHLCLKNVVWVRPLEIADQSVNIHIDLLEEMDESIRFEIYGDDRKNEERTIYCQGSIELKAAETRPRLDLESLRGACDGSVITSRECYELFRSAGIEYGETLKGIECIQRGEEYLLAQLSSHSTRDEAQYLLNATMLDSALQSCAGFMITPNQEPVPNQDAAPRIPVSLEYLVTYENCTSPAWAYLRRDQTGANGKVERNYIDICNASGDVCISIRGFSTRELKNNNVVIPQSGAVKFSESVSPETLMLVPVWETVGEKNSFLSNSSNDKLIFLGRASDALKMRELRSQSPFVEIGPKDEIELIAKKLSAAEEADHFLWISPAKSSPDIANDSVIANQEYGVITCFRIIKALLALGYGSKVISFTVVTCGCQSIFGDEIDPTHASIHGLVGSLAKEYPKWKIRLVDIEDGSVIPLREILILKPDPSGDAFAYRMNQWFKLSLLPLRNPAQKKEIIKNSGVYVVIGGAGGIGRVWSEYLVRNYQANVVWIGRRPLDSAIEATIADLSRLGPAPVYIQTDASNADALDCAYKKIKGIFSNVNGVIHSALVLEDKSLAAMDEEKFRRVLNAKVNVSVRLAQVFGKEPLDFILFFSSSQSYLKAAGQSNYAAGCTFIDSFARYLATSLTCAVKVISWGYWGSVGAVTEQKYRDRMAEIGVGSIEPDEGTQIVEQSLNGPIDSFSAVRLLRPLPIDKVSYKEILTTCEFKNPSYLKYFIETNAQSRLANSIATDDVRMIAEIESYARRLFSTQLHKIGLFPDKVTGLYPKLQYAKTAAQYSDWINKCIIVLNENPTEGDIEKWQNIKETVGDNDVWNRWNEKKTEWMAKKNLAEKIDLIESVLLLLPEILTSRVNAPVALLPKAGSISGEIVLAGGLGTSSLVKIMADIVNDYIHERLRHNHETKIRILEIGAGANSAIQLLLENLEPVKDVIEEYNITDISANSLHKIEKRVGKSRVNLRFGCFNAEFGPEDQDIATGVYDIVIAVDALQSAQNIRKRLRNIKMALKKNGLLLLKEIGQDTVISLITDGFLHVNGECDDSSERLNARPLLNPASLKILCELEGFRRINSPVSTFHRLGQHIIMAESDGVMRIESDQIAPEEKTAEGSSASTAMNASVPVIQSGESLRTGDLNQRVTRLIKDIIGDVLKIPPARMRNDEPFEKYGIDSISINQVTNRLSDILGTISSTLLFEYQTVESLVDHLVLTQREKLVNLLGGENTSNVRQENHAACSEKKPSLIKTSAKINNRRILRSGRSSHANVKEYDGMEIAVIGMAGRYAQAENVEEFWNNLCAGRNCITEIPIERWNWRDHFSSQKGQWGTMYSKWGGFMKQVDKFDHQFFNISLLEAEWMDPQERLFLETAYESIEDSGYIPSGLCASRKVGVFVGVMNSYYPSGANFHSVANRVSYHCDFKGPSVAIDTACSSSLTAVHFAIESLASGTSEIAIAGGVNVIIDPTHYIKLSAMGMLSPNDKCKAFGENADGIVGGEGVGAVVLKPLTKALAGNDNIYGVIKGSMINSGGKTHGFTVPNPVAHSELIEGAINKARVNARRISYVEAHGTGTELGDPIEITGLTRSFSKHTNEKQFCAIGSVKSNIGHCESAAGIASLTKVLLQLRNKRLVPSLHTQQTNSKIDFAATPFVVQSELVDWGPTILESDGQQKKYLRMAGVSSFGAGGANAHLIVEECDYNLESEKTILPDQSQNAVILLSAKNESSLKRYAERLLRAINSGKISNDNLQDVAYTLQVGRTAMEERLAFVARSVKEFDEKLSIFIGGDATAAGIFRGNALRSQTRLTKEIEWDAADIDIYSPAQFERMAELWTNGVSFDWIKIYAGVKRKRVSLPTYPFERKRCWTISNLLGQGSKNITEKGIPSILSLIDSSLNDLRISHCDANARDSVDTKEALDGLQELCEIMVLKTFREKEIILEAGTYEKKELRNKFFIVPEYFRLFDAILGILQRAGYIVLDTEGSIAVCEKAFRTETINKIERIQYYADDLIKRIPEIDSAIRLLTRCTNALLDVISGKKGSSEVMFPGGNVDLVRDVYKSYREYSELVSDVVKLCLKEMLRLDAKRTIRILEVGAGTGETTDCIVQAIGEFQENIQYLYTDISPIFVKNGKSHFTSKCDYMSFYVHDIEKSHIGQSIEEQSVDIIIAANVLHAMQRVDDTLQHIKGLLKPNGTLIVLEITKVFDYGTLTFGLTKGWWSYKDEELRLKDSPLLGRSGWTKSLEGNGFNHIRIVDFWRDSLFSQNVILAESNGVVEKQRVEIVLPANKTESTQTQSIAIQPSAIEGDSSAQSEIERSIAAIWKEILGVEQIGRFDSFQDLGGDSIVATQMISRLKGLFPFDLDLSGLFNARTVAGMAELIEEELMKRIDEMPEDAVKGLLSPELPQKR